MDENEKDDRPIDGDGDGIVNETEKAEEMDTGIALDDNTDIPTSELGVEAVFEVATPELAQIEANPMATFDSTYIDERLATMQNNIDAVKGMVDALQNRLAQVMSRINIVEQVADSTQQAQAVLTNDQFLTSALNKFI